ncbi:MAG: cell division protein ZapA [Paludibacter sp.]|nr:cell division protein ZapA [Paludibacter sp.]MDD4199550.1 cell division protein ZapA [Paludibacter sp.]MDD4427954.1 cell division protein ZapA [Paludibacter sp.]
MNDDIFTINVQIGGFPMALRIPRSDEEIYRRAEKLVTKLTEEFHHKYNQRAYEDILKLVAYQLAVKVSKNELKEDTTPLAEKIKLLEKDLDAVLNQK